MCMYFYIFKKYRRGFDKSYDAENYLLVTEKTRTVA